MNNWGLGKYKDYLCLFISKQTQLEPVLSNLFNKQAEFMGEKMLVNIKFWYKTNWMICHFPLSSFKFWLSTLYFNSNIILRNNKHLSTSRTSTRLPQKAWFFKYSHTTTSLPFQLFKPQTSQSSLFLFTTLVTILTYW